jgi:hypothetical protein
MAASTCPNNQLVKGSTVVLTVIAMATGVATRGYAWATVRRTTSVSTMPGTSDDHRVTHHSPVKRPSGTTSRVPSVVGNGSPPTAR